MVRTRNPQLWESLPQLKEQVNRLLRGVSVDVDFIRELEGETMIEQQESG